MENNNYTFFWKTDSVFSNWHPSVFTHEGITFNCSEQFMMYHKAKLFNDTEIMKKIMQTNSPKKQKELGRQVRNFNSEEWSKKCINIMKSGLKNKFQQNPEMLKKLFDTGNSIIVEASPFDRIWGIGYDSDNAIDNINNWGQNLLGKLLTDLRNDLLNGK